MWKEDFRIGVDKIDEQHKSLFEKTEELVTLFRQSGVEKKQECIDMILFLKGYAVQHFADEEEYSRSINSPNFEEHKAEHHAFIDTVLEHEKKMVAADFAETEVQDFIAVLLTWLLNHVMGTDQKIGKHAAQQKEEPKTILDIVRVSITDVFNHVAGIDRSVLKLLDSNVINSDEEIIIKLDFTGEAAGSITFLLPRSFAQNLVYSMVRFVPKVIDDFEKSVLFEVLNLIGGLIVSQIAETAGKKCELAGIAISSYDVNTKADKLILDTSIGVIEVNVALKM